MDLPTAIRKLARHVGLDFKPLVPRDKPITREEMDNVKGHLENLDGKLAQIDKLLKKVLEGYGGKYAYK